MLVIKLNHTKVNHLLFPTTAYDGLSNTLYMLEEDGGSIPCWLRASISAPQYHY